MDNALIGSLVGIALFLAGMFIKDKANKRDKVRRQVEDAKAREEAGTVEARQEYEKRMAQAEKDIEDAMVDRPVTDDPAADLADRLERLAERVRRRRQRNGTGKHAGRRQRRH